MNLKHLALDTAQFSASRPCQDLPFDAGQVAETGMDLLQQAIVTNFADPTLLERSLRAFQADLKLFPQDRTALCGMACLLLLSGDTAKALLFVNQILQTDLDHPLAQALWTALQKKPIAETVRARVSTDHAALLDSIKALLDHRLQLYNLAPDSKELQSLSGARSRLEQSIGGIEGLLQKLHQPISLIEEELETGQIAQRQQQLLMLLHRKQSLLKAFQLHDRLLDEVRQGRQHCRQLICQASQDQRADASVDVDHQLDLIFTSVDAVADQLDALYAGQYSLPELHQAYRAWLKDIQILQDVLDETG